MPVAGAVSPALRWYGWRCRRPTPYVVALVDLEEGPRMMSKITGCDPETVSIGTAVKVAFAEMPDAPPLPVFEPDND